MFKLLRELKSFILEISYENLVRGIAKKSINKI